jgi:hypothetical protein
MKGLLKLPTVHDNLNIAFTHCTFTHFVNGQVCGTGVVAGALTNDTLDVVYQHAEEGEEQVFRTVLQVSRLHYDGDTKTGYQFTPTQYDHIIK